MGQESGDVFDVLPASVIHSKGAREHIKYGRRIPVVPLREDVLPSPRKPRFARTVLCRKHAVKTGEFGAHSDTSSEFEGPRMIRERSLTQRGSNVDQTYTEEEFEDFRFHRQYNNIVDMETLEEESIPLRAKATDSSRSFSLVDANIPVFSDDANLQTTSRGNTDAPNLIKRYLSSTNFDVGPNIQSMSNHEFAYVSSATLLNRLCDGMPIPEQSHHLVVGSQQADKHIIISQKSVIWLGVLLMAVGLIVCLVIFGFPLAAKGVARSYGASSSASSEATLKGNGFTSQVASERYNMCSATPCKRDGLYLQELLSWATDPCDNFYHFVCSRWNSTTQDYENRDLPISAYDDLVHILEERVKSLLERPSCPQELSSLQNIYHKCMNTRELDIEDWNPMLEVLWLVTLEGFPFTSKSTKSSVWKVSAKTLRATGTETLLSVRAASHLVMNTSVVVVGPPTILAPKAANFSETKSFYNISAHAAMSGLKTPHGLSLLCQEVANFGAELEFLVYTKSVHPGVRTHSFEMLKNHLELSAFFTSLFSNSDSSERIGRETEVLIEPSDYMKDLISLVRSTHQYVVLNYIAVRLMIEMSPFLPTSAYRLTHSLVESIYKRRRPHLLRWKLCIRATERAAPLLFLHASRLAYQTHFAVASVEKHLKALTGELDLSLNDIAILDSASKIKARKLLKRFRFSLFHPHWLTDNEKLLEFVNEMPRTQQGQGLRSFYTLRGFSFYESLHQDPDDDWLGSAFDTDCRYSDRTVYVPALLFNFSLVNFGGNEAFQLPNAGLRIMRCVLRMILRGISSRSDNAPRRWWPDLASSFLKSYELCLQEYDIANVSTMPLVETTAAVRPVLNVYLSERGANIRFENLQKYGAYQLFFVYYAIGFCEVSHLDNATVAANSLATSLLVNVPLWNNRAFQETFQCPVGSAMNPRRKCVIWKENPNDVAPIKLTR
ncbi:neprilysin-21-like [Ornithodoros turicata]|uniref:neprilysin-21-like n=1 Tax=Ornithodoros turicata TaxID=34597 RepID=UPI003139EF71